MTDAIAARTIADHRRRGLRGATSACTDPGDDVERDDDKRDADRACRNPLDAVGLLRVGPFHTEPPHEYDRRGAVDDRIEPEAR